MDFGELGFEGETGLGKMVKINFQKQSFLEPMKPIDPPWISEKQISLRSQFLELR